jgi:hypothetical protein
VIFPQFEMTFKGKDDLRKFKTLYIFYHDVDKLISLWDQDEVWRVGGARRVGGPLSDESDETVLDHLDSIISIGCCGGKL